MGTTASKARERSFYRGNITNKHDRGSIIKTKPREVMLSMSPPRPRVDRKRPSSAPETSHRCRGSFVASWPIVAQARGPGDAAGAAHAHRAAAHPARRRGEERPRARRHDGVEAPLRHCARHAAAPPAGVAVQRFAAAWPGLNCFLGRARVRAARIKAREPPAPRCLICNSRRNSRGCPDPSISKTRRICAAE